MKNISGLVAIFIVGFLYFGQPFYTIDETEQVIITQFGKPIGEAITEAGLHFKVPFIQTVNYFPKNLLSWDSDPGQVPTQDKTFIWVDAFARWYIKDPLEFYKAVNNVQAAQKKLDDILDAATYNFVTSHHLIEVVRSSNRMLKSENIATVGLPDKIDKQATIKMGRQEMTRGILEQAAPKLEKFGIAIVDFRIKRINYVEEVLKKVYERMIAERDQISEKFRSEGNGESKKIQGDREKELRRIQSEAYRKVEEIKGKADAEATRIYAEAFNKDPEFYSFVMTLDIYKKALGEDTRVILSTNSDFFKYLKHYKQSE
ncbi:MAG: protease modulator HflC [Pseudomonadota bacterium]